MCTTQKIQKCHKGSDNKPIIAYVNSSPSTNIVQNKRVQNIKATILEISKFAYRSFIKDTYEREKNKIK